MILKRTAAALMAAAMMFGTAAASGSNFIKAAAAQDRNGVCSCTYVDVRKDANSNSAAKGWLDGGDAVSILGEKYDSNGKLWYKIQFELLVGYVPADSISVNGAKAASSSDFESYLDSQAFPESYRIYLRELHKQHPNWIFKAQHVGIDWDTAVSEETVVGRNLVHNGAPDSWKSRAKGAYDPDTDSWYQLDTGWVAASDSIIKYYLDPRNFLTENYIFMFENLSYDPDVHTKDGVEAILRGTFMDGGYTCPDTGEWYNYADTFMEAAEVSGVSPYHLASRCRNEQGVYGAPQSLGTVEGYENYFNFFDVGAYATSTMTAGAMGARYATNYNDTYMLPWTNQYKSIVGGSIFLGNGYITKEQDTLYLQKFDVTDGGNGYFAHQYMTCVFGQANEAVSLLKAYSDEVLDSAMEFKIPVYNNMPSTRCPKPDSEWDDNDYLSNLSISGVKISPAFNSYTESYTAKVSADTKSVNVSAESSSNTAGVYGTGEITLKDGKNTIEVSCVSPAGTTRVYKITVDKAAKAAAKKNTKNTSSKYDINGDGKTNITDVVVVAAHVSGKKHMKSSAEKKADIDGNGSVDIADALLIMRYIKYGI